MMKRNLYSYIVQLLFVVPILFCSCEKDIVFNDGAAEPFVVVNSFCEAGKAISMNLVASRPIEGFDSSFVSIEGATVKLFVDNVEAEELYYNKVDKDGFHKYDYTDSNAVENESTYKSKTICELGKNYRIQITHPDYKNVSCETTIPMANESITIDTISSDPNCPTNISGRKANFKFRFTDPANEENYYRIIVTYREGKYPYGYDLATPEKNDFITVTEESPAHISINDPIIFPGSNDADDLLYGSPDNSYRVFSDEMINGNTHEFTVYVNNYWYNSPYNRDLYENEFVYFYATLQAITKDEYLYLSSLNANKYYEGEFFFEPVLVYTNVTNGRGIFGGATSITKCVGAGEYPIEGVEYRYYKNGSFSFIPE